MKRAVGWLPLCMTAALLAANSPISRGVTSDGACMANARASLDALARGDFVTAGKDFSPATASELPAARIKQAWQSVQQIFGVYRGHGTPHHGSFHGQPVIVTRLDLAIAAEPLDFVVGCDASNRIRVFAFLKSSAVDAVLPVKALTEADGARVKPLDVPSPDGPLRGALSLPGSSGPFPAVVLVQGSGPQDLDESIGPDKPFRDIADGLAKAGIASLRYDKRTFDHAAKMRYDRRNFEHGSMAAANPDFTVDDEITDDALSALRLLARQPGIDPHRMFVLGHSLGAEMAPRIAERDPHLAGIIMLAAPARPLLMVLSEQLREIGPRQGIGQRGMEGRLKAIAAERALLAKTDQKHPPAGSFEGVPQSYWFSLHDYDQVAVAKSLSLPMLILQGGNDIQVSPSRDFDAWKKALAGKSGVTFRLYPALSHLFMPGPTRSAADYEKPHHVDSQVIRDIAGWIKAQPPAK